MCGAATGGDPMRLRITLAAGIVFGVGLAAADASILRVPEDYSSVLAAVDAAVSGDSVLVQPGTWTDTAIRIAPTGAYVKSTLFVKPGITVLGLGGPEVTTLDVGPEVGAFAVTITNNAPGSAPSYVIGFTITGGGTGVGGYGGSPLELHDCRIVDNPRQAANIAYTRLTLVGGTITGNAEGQSSPQWGCVFGHESALELRQVTIERNSNVFGVVFDSQPQSVRLIDCTFLDQTLACRVWDCPDFVVENCSFVRCSDGGIQVRNCQGRIEFTTFAYDTSGAGGGAQLSRSTIEVSNNTFYRCHTDGSAAALSVSFTDGGVHNNIFTGCTTPRGTVSFGGGTQHPSTGCNLFWDNEGDDFWNDWVPAPTDIEADPEFCNETVLDLTLHSTSPAASANSACGLLGAFDVGCGSVSVDATSWGRLKNLYRSSDHEDR
ncbi:MAG: right-handed parallel beta-helix repeat-containing protein [bacterium]